MSVADIKAFVTANEEEKDAEFKLDFIKFCKEEIAKITNKGTAGNLQTALNSLISFIKTKEHVKYGTPHF